MLRGFDNINEIKPAPFMRGSFIVLGEKIQFLNPLNPYPLNEVFPVKDQVIPGVVVAMFVLSINVVLIIPQHRVMSGRIIVSRLQYLVFATGNAWLTFISFSDIPIEVEGCLAQ